MLSLAGDWVDLCIFDCKRNREHRDPELTKGSALDLRYHLSDLFRMMGLTQLWVTSDAWKPLQYSTRMKSDLQIIF